MHVAGPLSANAGQWHALTEATKARDPRDEHLSAGLR